VGIAEGIFGIFCAAAGIPAGWIADRMRRDRTLRLCGFVMLGMLCQSQVLNIRNSTNLAVVTSSI
jgi:F0F1-type ATP synthase assembly protein I